jgi:hypothetical protein
MPGVLDLTTDLKSLKYGQDQPGGGNSGQPYIKIDINDVDRGINRLRFTNFDDGFIRGGAIGVINASVTDTLRIGKFLVDFPKGPLFIAKQIGLQLSNPQLEHVNTLSTNRTGANRPTRGQGLVSNVGNFFANVGSSVGSFISNTTNRIENAVGPTRIYNLGINTLAQVPVNAIGGHIYRHGFLPNNDSSKTYESVVTQNNFVNNHNRLELYAGEFALGGFGGGIRLQDKTTWNDSTELNKYISGPGSVYGIGNTLINRYTNTNNKSAIYRSLDFSKSGVGKIAEIQISGNTANFLTPISVFKSSSIFVSGSNNFDIASVGSKSVLADYLWSDPVIPPIQGGLSRNTKDKPKIAETYDYGISKISGSTLVTSTFDLTSDLNPNSSFLYKTGLEYSGSNPFQGGVSRVTQEQINIANTIDYAISKTTGSSLISSNYGDLTSDLNPNSSFLYKTGTEYTGSTSRKQTIPLNNDSDVVDNGPSSYPQASGFKYQINTPTTVYINPSAQKYIDLKTKVSTETENKQRETISINRNSSTYKYFNGNKRIPQFERTNDTSIDNDTLAIVFNPLDPFTGTSLGELKFLAYITQFSNTFDSQWNDVKYIGRAEKFYIFNEFKRSSNLDFNIPCYNREKLTTQHQVLNNLISTLAGSYQNDLLLGGIITKIKVGNYINNQPCIITSLNFNPIDESSWDLDAELAFYIKVSMNFTVIHDFLPQYNNDNLKNFITIPSP